MEDTAGPNGHATAGERLAVVGSGAIACGLAATAAQFGEVILVARSETSARRAQGRLESVCARLSEDPLAERVRVVRDLEALAGASFVLETVLEDLEVKRGLLEALGRVTPPETMLGTTTSSLSVQALAEASGAPERFVGFHPFNPVPRMKLLEVAFPREASAQTRTRALAYGEALGKTVVEVPDSAGFVVNRLLFPYLFGAVELMEQTGMEAGDVDTCMTLGAGHPMGPLALLDYVGLDVAEAIGRTMSVPVPAQIKALIEQGALGKKVGRGFYSYPT